MSMQRVAAVITLLKQYDLYDSFIANGGQLGGNETAFAAHQLVQLICRQPDFDSFLYVIRSSDWATEQLQHSPYNAQVDGSLTQSTLDIMVSEYIEIYLNMSAGKILEITSLPHFRKIRQWLDALSPQS